MSEPRIIKKYPNRRLYDTEISSYITLEDVKRLVLEQIEIKVIDARTQVDLTHATLLQIILEQEENGPSLFTTDSLQKMIRSYGSVTQHLFFSLFEQGLSFLAHQQNTVKQDQPERASEEKASPVQAMADFAQKNMAHWQQFQQEWLHNFVTHMQKEPKKNREAQESEHYTAPSSSSSGS